mmetsp:Transcript_9405/g.10364  ORF Transcript_9405/g.10364 Transcript_9405/m.10364 type:complete len:174 (-) Transcript_9405:403-924(-)
MYALSKQKPSQRIQQIMNTPTTKFSEEQINFFNTSTPPQVCASTPLQVVSNLCSWPTISSYLYQLASNNKYLKGKLREQPEHEFLKNHLSMKLFKDKVICHDDAVYIPPRVIELDSIVVKLRPFLNDEMDVSTKQQIVNTLSIHGEGSCIRRSPNKLHLDNDCQILFSIWMVI